MVVIDCTETGASPPTATDADLDLAGLAPRREDRRRGGRAYREMTLMGSIIRLSRLMGLTMSAYSVSNVSDDEHGGHART